MPNGLSIIFRGCARCVIDGNSVRKVMRLAAEAMGLDRQGDRGYLHGLLRC